jgi:dTDP-4-dehydrorhamnose 3,5-epimerase
LVYI